VATDRDLRRVVLLVMCAGYFLVLLDTTIVNVALPSIASDLGASVDGLQWVVDAYLITLAALMLAGGTVGDLHGHKRIVLAGLALFATGSLACGIAPTTGVLVAARIVQGAGAAALLPGTLAIITHTYPQRGEQARAIGVWAGVGSVALPAGPLAGGVLIEAVGWRAVFVVNLPVVIAGFVLTLRLVRESRERDARRLDASGTALAALTLAAVTFAIVQAGRAGVDAAVVVAAAAAVLALAAFLRVEWARRDPMLPLGLLRRAGFSTANAVACSMNLATLGLLFVLTLFLQTVQHRSALEAGLALLPLFLPLSVLAPLAGRATAKVGPRAPMVAGLLVAAAGVVWLGGLQAGSGYLTLLPALALWGIGLGLLTPAVVAAAMGAVPAARAGLASATNNTSRVAGSAIGIAAFGAVAGAPSAPPSFMRGLHVDALVAAGLWVAAALATVLLIPSARE
jgi:MFS transporter, DHA2 family, methylenomycin A resistance protein